jgi:hypothetical protein
LLESVSLISTNLKSQGSLICSIERFQLATR